VLVLVNVFSRPPDAVSRVFARGLNAVTKPFDGIDYYGSCAAAFVYNHRRVGAKTDRVIAALQRRLAREQDEFLYRGKHFPIRTCSSRTTRQWKTSTATPDNTSTSMCGNFP
jgi:hypothetical protein